MVIAKFSIPIVSVIGIILTTVAIISILTKKTKWIFQKYIIVRFLLFLLLFFIGSTYFYRIPINYLLTKITAPYFQVFYSLWLNLIPMRILTICVRYHMIFLLLNRLNTKIDNKSSIFRSLKMKFLLGSLFVFGILSSDIN